MPAAAGERGRDRGIGSSVEIRHARRRAQAPNAPADSVERNYDLVSNSVVLCRDVRGDSRAAGLTIRGRCAWEGERGRTTDGEASDARTQPRIQKLESEQLEIEIRNKGKCKQAAG